MHNDSFHDFATKGSNIYDHRTLLLVNRSSSNLVEKIEFTHISIVRKIHIDSVCNFAAKGSNISVR